jgi:hypothetical protein
VAEIFGPDKGAKMPTGFGTTVSSMTITANVATFSGSNFADLQLDPTAGVWLSANGGTTKIWASIYTSWADDTIVARFSGSNHGDYTSAGVVSGSGEASNVLSGTWTIARAAMTGRHMSLSLALSA